MENKMQKKDEKMLKKYAKNLVDKQIYKKIKKIEEEKERANALKHAILFSLELKYYELEKKINDLKKHGKDVFFPYANSHKIMPKLRLLKLDFNEKDFKNLVDLVKGIEEELKNV
ncbi:MAG: hypothetical protein ACP5OG_05655 [Candidatus Nanoarchaeia archaeon]